MFGYILVKRKTIHELHDKVNELHTHVYHNGEFLDEKNPSFKTAMSKSNEILHWDKYGIISEEIYNLFNKIYKVKE